MKSKMKKCDVKDHEDKMKGGKPVFSKFTRKTSKSSRKSGRSGRR